MESTLSDAIRSQYCDTLELRRRILHNTAGCSRASAVAVASAGTPGTVRWPVDRPFRKGCLAVVFTNVEKKRTKRCQ